MTLNTTGSIATFLASTFNFSTVVSGNLINIVDLSRQHVENYVGILIPADNIEARYVPAIVDFSKADAIEQEEALEVDSVSLESLKVSDSSRGGDSSSKLFKTMGNEKLTALGRKARFSRSLS